MRLYILAHVTARPARRGESSRAGWVLPALIVVTLAATALLYVRGDLNPILCDGPCPPRYVTAPVGLAAADPAGDTPTLAGDGPVDGKELLAAVTPALSSADLGERAGFVAVDARSGKTLAEQYGDAFVPASTAKVLTAFAALTTIGPETRFSTRVVRDGDRLILVGGGDPYLTATKPRASATRRADLATLAERTARAVGSATVTLGYDTSLFSGTGVSPGWSPGYISGGIVAPVSPLWIDRGRVGAGRSADPAGDAARAFAAALEDAGVTVSGQPSRVTAPKGATAIAAVEGGTVARIVEDFLTTSDNEVAEVMLRQAALAAGRPGSFSGGSATVAAVLKTAGISVKGLKLQDGSGLSRGDRITPLTLAQTLAAADGARTGSILSGLPVGGFTGTLAGRYARLGDARGLVRAKTGTLTGVHSLAGIATLSGGRPVAFALMTDQTEAVNPFVTQAALDRAAADIAGCPCMP